VTETASAPHPVRSRREADAGHRTDGHHAARVTDPAGAFLHEHGGGLPADLPPELRLVALVAHARDVASEVRESFGDAAAGVARDPRAILLRTCHRVELYLTGSAFEGPDRLSLPPLPEGVRRLEGTDAARHVFRVAAGLESVVVGEDQVLHQLRECVADRRLPAAAGCPVDVGSEGPQAAGLEPLLERLFQVAFHLGRETRSWRQGAPRSLGDVALDRVLSVTGPLDGRRVLVVGAGRMARLAAIAAARSGAHVVVSNRTTDHAQDLARDANGEVVPFGADAALPAVDAVVLAISAHWPLSVDARSALLAAALPVVDLSSPPALDHELREALGSRYTSVDDLARGDRGEIGARLDRRYRRALDAALTGFTHWVRARSSVPAIQALSELAEERRAQEVDRLFRRTDLSETERELVVQMSHRLVAGLLHTPLVTLREDASGDLERAARTLFAL
jgi:glutamyl-tRNA reductase